MLLRNLRRSVLVAAATACLVVGSSAAWAGPGTVASTVAVSGVSPFAGCTADAVGSQPGINYLHTEVEPWIAASSVDRNGDGAVDVITGYQQDRWDNGAARGVVASVLYQGRWVQVTIPGTSACAGGAGYPRATDPWVSFSPNGVAYFFTLSTSAGNLSAMLVNRSTDGGLTWSAPTVLIREDDPEHFNDKNSLTADPLNSNYAYAIWDRSRFPSDKRYQHSVS